MPYLMIQTNLKVDEVEAKALLAKASGLVAAELGKPESYVMVALEAKTAMLFAGDDSPLAILN